MQILGSSQNSCGEHHQQHCCLWWRSKCLLDRFICHGTFDLQLPNLRGQACESMGKSSRCMGHSAWMVNLRTERGFSTQGCFYRHQSRGLFLNPSTFAWGETGWRREAAFAPAHNQRWYWGNTEKYISRVHQDWAVWSAPDANREMVLIISLIHV